MNDLQINTPSQTTILDLQKHLTDVRAVYSVLGNICKDANLLREPEYALNESDFNVEFYKVIFTAINNIIFSDTSIQKVTEIDIDNYLASYPAYYKIWEMNNGLEYIHNAILNSNSDTFNVAYEMIKKFSLLYLYNIKGIDTRDIYDYTLVTDSVAQKKMRNELEKMKIEDIAEHYSMKFMNIREEFNFGSEIIKFKAGDDIENVFVNLQKKKDYGYPFKNGFYNDIFRGMRKKKYFLRSADTGTGKTRQMLADMVDVAVPYIYDIDLKLWRSNNGSYPALFISTELEKEELQVTMLAIISGVSEDILRDGIYTPDVQIRLDKAMEILKDAPIYCEYVEDFSVSDIEMTIEKNIIEHNVEFVAFDYMQVVPKLSRTMSKSFGTVLRDDQILVYFSSALKRIANKYEIYLISATQLNKSSKDTMYRDASALRGGRATADKVDAGVLTFFVTAEDKKNISTILNSGMFKVPNFSHWVYKNRGGKRAYCIVWTVMDLGNMREKELFVTDYEYNLLDNIELKRIQIENNLVKVETEDADNQVPIPQGLPPIETRSFKEGFNQPLPNF